jgi:hypothetical protein
MVSRFVQAFGGSLGSVLGQALCRDAFHGPTLGKVYASVGGALSISRPLAPSLVASSTKASIGRPFSCF